MIQRRRGGGHLARGWQPIIEYRYQLQALLDALTWCVALFVTTWLRYEFDLARLDGQAIAVVGLVAGGIQVAVGWTMGLYRGRWRFGSFEEVAALARTAVLVTAVVVIATNLPDAHPVPTSAAIVGGGLVLMLTGGCRYAWRLYLDSRMRPVGDHLRRTIVAGAGEAGSQLLTAMLRNPQSPYLPVALLDDSPKKQRLTIRGVPVLGTIADLPSVADEQDADVVIVAIPSGDGTLIREISQQAVDAGVGIRVLPPVEQLLGGPADVGDVRRITTEDLLGRHKIDTDVRSIADYLRARRVLVTGAGGSIGAELCRQINRYAPAELVMVDRDESALHTVQLSLEGRALLDSPNLVVADIRDRARVHEVFLRHRPEVVFHAAALKHLPLMERHPREAVKTNVWGTQHVLEAAAAQDVERFVNVSTDKAADPTSVLGYTKRITERLTADMAGHTAGAFISVRFGNVLGSRGSVLETFQRQIDDGGPVTVTSRDVRRYFMTVEEAVELVIQAGAIGADGDVLVLDMGDPVRILDVAEALVADADRRIEIVFTGLRPGEKMEEARFSALEVPRPSAHPLISAVAVQPLESADLAELDSSRDLREALARLADGESPVTAPGRG